MASHGPFTRLSPGLTGPSRAYGIKMLAESADGTEQEWVDFYLIGADGGTLRGAVKVLQSQDSCLPYQYKSKHAQCVSSLSMLLL
eukprot:14978-Heterococcus_DN1.PRE.5